MDQDFFFKSDVDPLRKYRVVVHCPPDMKREEFFESRIKAQRLLEELADQGFAVMMSQVPSC